MRKVSFVKSLIVVSVLAAGAAQAATVTVNGGIVRFKGEIVNAACAIDADSMDQTVQLGQVKTASLAEVGKTSDKVKFSIKLNDCDTTVAKTAAIGFSGPTVDSTNTTALAIDGSAAGSAKNVGIQILDATGTPMTLNGATFSSNYTLINGSNTLNFDARYISTGIATPGSANGSTNFQVQYQ